MKAIWLACCACGDYGLLQREVEGRDAGAQVLRVGDLDGLISMARAFPSRRGAAIIAASLFDTEDVRKTVARLTAEGRVSRVVVLIEALDPSDIEGLFRAGATEVIAAHSICGNGRAGEGAVDSDRRMTIEPDAFVDREPGAPRATRGPRVDDYGKAEAEHGRRPRNPLVCDDAGGPAQHAGDSPAVDMGYVHGVNLADELDEVEGFAGCGELSLMRHEQIAQNEPASQTEQAAMPAWTQRVVAAGETGTLSPTPAPPPPMPPADAAAPQHRAPVICAISGSGGCGKSTIVATMAHTSSLLGLRAAWLHESSFRLEVYLFVVLAPLALWLGADGVERALLVGSMVLVLSAELLNSAVEAVIERYGAEHHELAGRAKDMGSAAVFVLMMNVLLVWGLVLGPRLL